MPEYESLRWPIEMLKGGWIAASNVVRSFKRLAERRGEVKDHDYGRRRGQINGCAVNERHGEGLLTGGPDAGEEKKLDIFIGPQGRTIPLIEGIEEEDAADVSMAVVKGAGRHIQNDVQAERAAEVFRRFLGGL